MGWDCICRKPRRRIASALPGAALRLGVVPPPGPRPTGRIAPANDGSLHFRYAARPIPVYPERRTVKGE
jgi:hypothetical protein